MSSKQLTVADVSADLVSTMLIRETRNFQNSEELARLDNHDRSIVGIVCGALANYITRVQSLGDPDRVLESAFAVIERLSSLRDFDIDNLVVTEILENIDFGTFPELRIRLGATSAMLYQKWLA